MRTHTGERQYSCAICSEIRSSRRLGEPHDNSYWRKAVFLCYLFKEVRSSVLPKQTHDNSYFIVVWFYPLFGATLLHWESTHNDSYESCLVQNRNVLRQLITTGAKRSLTSKVACKTCLWRLLQVGPCVVFKPNSLQPFLKSCAYGMAFLYNICAWYCLFRCCLLTLIPLFASLKWHLPSILSNKCFKFYRCSVGSHTLWCNVCKTFLSGRDTAVSARMTPKY